MFILTKIFGEGPRVKILEAFADNFEDEISIQDLIWLTDMPKTTIYNYINRLLDEKIILEGTNVKRTQFYRLNKEKSEVKIIVSLVNYIVTEKLAYELVERGLKQID